MQKIKFLTLSLLFILSGCWSANEIDKFYYAYSIALDYSDGMYAAYVQYVKFSSNVQAEGGSSGGGNESGVVGHGRGKTIETAFHNIYKSTPLKTYWGHLSTIILTDRILNKEPLEFVQNLARYANFRYTPWIFTTNDSIDELLTILPFFNMNVAYSLYSDPMEDYNQNSLILPIRLHEYVADSFEPGRTVIIPQLSVNKTTWYSDKGQTPAVEISGGSLQKDGKLKGTLKNEELGGLKWLQKETKLAPLIVEDEDGEIGVIIIEKVKVNVKPIQSENNVKFNLDIVASGTIIEMAKNVPVSYFIEVGEKQMKKDILSTFEKALELDADIYQLGDSLYRHNPQLFHRLAQKNNHLPLTKDSIENLSTTLKIKHTGRLKYPPLK